MTAKLTGAAWATLKGALREMGDGNRDEALDCLADMGTGELNVAADLLETTAALHRRVAADREIAHRRLRLVSGQ